MSAFIHSNKMLNLDYLEQTLVKNFFFQKLYSNQACT